MSNDYSSTNDTEILIIESVNRLKVELPHVVSSPTDIVSKVAVYRWLHNQNELLATISGDKSFGALRSGWLSFWGTGRTFDSRALTGHLITRVLAGDRAAEVIGAMRDLAMIRESAGVWYAAIIGAKVAARIEISDGINVVSWADIPDCAEKAQIDERGIGTLGPMPRPDCAIRIQLPTRRVLFDSYSDADAAGANLSEWAAARLCVDDIVRSLTVISGKPVTYLASWTLPQHKSFYGVIGTGMHLSFAAGDMTLGFAASEAPIVDPAAFESFYVGLNGFDAGGRAALAIAIDRLNASLRRTSLADKAIDLGIAIEILILHQIDGGGEFTYRASVRAARFLAGDPVVRMKTYNTIKATYSLRSKAVHKGFIDSSASNKKTLDEALSLVVSILEKLVGLGRFPKWEQEVVI